MKGAVLEQKKLKKSGFYKKRILEIQENFKLFTVAVGAVSVVMLALNIANACAGFIGLGWTIFLDVVWAACVGGLVAYILFGAKQKQECFRKIDEITYGDNGDEYEPCEVEEGAEPLKRGSAVRLYESENSFCLITDGMREKPDGFWTKYDFKHDFGALRLSKEAFQRFENEGIIILEGEDERICLRRKAK